MPGSDGEDACLGLIPGAKQACCGHGTDPGYVLWPGQTIGQTGTAWLAGVRVVEA